MDVEVLVATALGGLIAAIAAFGGSVWLERSRARRAREQAAKHVLQELSDLRIPIASLAEHRAWYASVGFSRSAWLEARTVLADDLTLGEMEAISNSYLWAQDVFEEFDSKGERSYGEAEWSQDGAGAALAAIDLAAGILLRHLPTDDRHWPPDPPRRGG